MKLYLSLIFSLSTLFYSPYISASMDKPEPSYASRLWTSLFGASAPVSTPQCQKCKDNPGATHIEHANLLQGGGNHSSSGVGSPTTIANMHGNFGGNSSSGMSEAGMIALEKEKTKQLELANAHKLQEEHERNKWFNTLTQYIDKRSLEVIDKTKEESERNKAELFAHGTAMLDAHHATLRQIGKEQSENELEKERIRQQGLPAMLAHDLQKAELIHKQALEKLTHIGRGIYAFTEDKSRMAKVSAMIGATALGIYGAKRGTKVVAQYASALLMKPALVTETSRLSLNQILRHPIRSFRPSQEQLAKATYNASLQKDTDRYVASIQACKKNGQPFRNALFFGPPGTGKTLLAKKIARDLNMDYAIVAGGNVDQFSEEQAIEEVNKLFDWAEQSKKGTILFFDECDALTPNRLNATAKSRKIQNTLYTRTGTESRKFLTIGATNLQEILDPAFTSRADVHYHFPLPDKQTRVNLLRGFFEQYISKVPSNANFANEMETHFEWIADKTEGFSGRNISQLVRSIQAHVATSDSNAITQSVIEEVVNNTLEQRANLNNSTTQKHSKDN